MSDLRAAAPLLGLSLLTHACAVGVESPPPPAGAPIWAAVDPDATLVTAVDLQRLRQAAAYPILLAVLGHPEREDDPYGPAATLRRVEEATGLRSGHFISFVMSARVHAPYFPDAESPAAYLKALIDVVPIRRFCLSFQLAQDLDPDRLEMILREARSPTQDTYTRAELDGTLVLHRSAPPTLPDPFQQPTVPELWAAVVGGNTAFFSDDEALLAAALQRARTGELADVSPELQDPWSRLPEDVPIRTAFQFPEELRVRIRRLVDDAQKDPAAPNAIGLLTPLTELRSMALAVDIADDIQVVHAYDVAAEATASRGAALYTALLVPTAQATIAQALQRPLDPTTDRFSFSGEGSTLIGNVHLTGEALRALARQWHLDDDDAKAAPVPAPPAPKRGPVVGPPKRPEGRR